MPILLDIGSLRSERSDSFICSDCLGDHILVLGKLEHIRNLIVIKCYLDKYVYVIIDVYNIKVSTFIWWHVDVGLKNNILVAFLSVRVVRGD